MMTIGRKIIVWQPALTDHQAFTYQSLAQISGQPLIVYVSGMKDLTRRALGRTETTVSALEQRSIPKRGFLHFCYRHLTENRNDVHIFNSPFEQPKLIMCLFLAAWIGVETYLISEPYSPMEEGYFTDNNRWLGKLKATLRPLLYRGYAAFLRHRISGIFAISDLALFQYQNAGMPPAKLFPFGYFVPVVDESRRKPDRPVSDPSRCVRIIFVGSLIHRKGLDLLETAVEALTEQGCIITVDVFGPGDASRFAKKCPSLRYCGTIPFGEAQTVIAQYDLLVLPSRHDGWGIVVNEALCAGVPVVCSDTAGASSVAEAFGAGLSFLSGDAVALSKVLLRLARDPSLLQLMRCATATAANTLQPKVAARYMLEVIGTPEMDRGKLIPPWRQICTRTDEL